MKKKLMFSAVLMLNVIVLNLDAGYRLSGQAALNELESNYSCVNCDLSRADLRNKNFRGADFTASNLTGVNFSGADLEWARF